MDFTLWQLLLIMATMAAAGLLQGLVGIGFGLLATGLLSLFLDVKDASVMLIPASLAINWSIFIRLRKEFSWDRVVPLICSTLAAVPFGAYILLVASANFLISLLSIVVIAAAVQDLIPCVAGKRWHPVSVGVPVGLLSGLLSGSLGTGGPPTAAYALSQDFSRLRYAATMQLSLGASAVVRLAVLGGTQQFRHVALVSLGGVLAAVAGALIGNALMTRMTDKTISTLARGLLGVLGVRYLLKAVLDV